MIYGIQKEVGFLGWRKKKMTLREKIYETFNIVPALDDEPVQNIVFTSYVLQKKFKDTNMTYAEKLKEITGLPNINPMYDYTIFNDDGFLDKEVTEKVDERGTSKEMTTSEVLIDIKEETTRYLKEEYFPSDEFRQLVKENVLRSSQYPEAERVSNADEHYARINHLLEALQEARIYAGAEFEACCNEMEHGRAIYFSGFRDMLATYIRSLEDYLTILTKEEESRCPVCGKKTSMGKNGGKICFDCVNRKRN